MKTRWTISISKFDEEGYCLKKYYHNYVPEWAALLLEKIIIKIPRKVK